MAVYIKAKSRALNRAVVVVEELKVVLRSPASGIELERATG